MCLKMSHNRPHDSHVSCPFHRNPIPFSSFAVSLSFTPSYLALALRPATHSTLENAFAAALHLPAVTVHLQPSAAITAAVISGAADTKVSAPAPVPEPELPPATKAEPAAAATPRESSRATTVARGSTTNSLAREERGKGNAVGVAGSQRGEASLSASVLPAAAAGSAAGRKRVEQGKRKKVEEHAFEAGNQSSALLSSPSPAPMQPAGTGSSSGRVASGGSRGGSSANGSAGSGVSGSGGGRPVSAVPVALRPREAKATKKTMPLLSVRGSKVIVTQRIAPVDSNSREACGGGVTRGNALVEEHSGENSGSVRVEVTGSPTPGYADVTASQQQVSSMAVNAQSNYGEALLQQHVRENMSWGRLGAASSTSAGDVTNMDDPSTVAAIGWKQSSGNRSVDWSSSSISSLILSPNYYSSNSSSNTSSSNTTTTSSSSGETGRATGMRAEPPTHFARRLVEAMAKAAIEGEQEVPPQQDVKQGGTEAGGPWAGRGGGEAEVRAGGQPQAGGGGRAQAGGVGRAQAGGRAGVAMAGGEVSRAQAGREASRAQAGGEVGGAVAGRGVGGAMTGWGGGEMPAGGVGGPRAGSGARNSTAHGNSSMHKAAASAARAIIQLPWTGRSKAAAAAAARVQKTTPATGADAASAAPDTDAASAVPGVEDEGPELQSVNTEDVAQALDVTPRGTTTSRQPATAVEARAVKAQAYNECLASEDLPKGVPAGSNAKPMAATRAAAGDAGSQGTALHGGDGAARKESGSGAAMGSLPSVEGRNPGAGVAERPRPADQHHTPHLRVPNLRQPASDLKRRASSLTIHEAMHELVSGFEIELFTPK